MKIEGKESFKITTAGFWMGAAKFWFHTDSKCIVKNLIAFLFFEARQINLNHI